MQFFYDKQIRRYLVQIIRLFSNFTVKYGDGTLHQIPVSYGDPDRQAAAIIRQNSENAISSVPRIAVHISDLQLDRTRLADATHVGKVHIRERNTYIDDVPGSPTYGQEVYGSGQGKNYTVERLMPTPFKLTVKVDIWSSSTEQKLQILEQILVLFNPSLEIQTTDNYIDWTSLSVLDLTQVSWSSRSIPVGTNDAIDLASLTLESPIWISPPAKVKNLGVITNIITSMYASLDDPVANYIDGLGTDGLPTTGGGNSTGMSDLLSTQYTNTSGSFGILVLNGQGQILNAGENVSASNDSIDIPTKYGVPVNWDEFLATANGEYVAGSSKIYLMQNTGYEVSGTFTVNPLDHTVITINWDSASYPSNSSINTAFRPLSPGTFDRIVDPTTFVPGTVTAGTRYLIIEAIDFTQPNLFQDSTVLNYWKNNTVANFSAAASDIIEWNGADWIVIFDAAQSSDVLIYQTNIYTGVQYKWNGVSWVKSFEGEYRAGLWRVAL